MTATNHSYLTDQLIPYIGNKRKLLPLIKQAIERSGVEDGVFFDAFAGSGVVSRLAKMMGFKVIANDWEPYAETINTAYISVNREPAFGGFGGLDRAISELNALNGVRGYIASHYCPCDDENYDTDTERMFYTQHNGRKIDAVREQIARWRDSGRLSRQEEALLLAPLIYQASYCSNTSGVFKGFHNGWGGATKTMPPCPEYCFRKRQKFPYPGKPADKYNTKGDFHYTKWKPTNPQELRDNNTANRCPLQVGISHKMRA